jgi:5'-nucleotidase (lipoprotein e(P4) family)
MFLQRATCAAAFASLLAGCAATGPRATPSAQASGQAPAPDDTRGAMAWMQTAAEYDAQNLMVYAAARVAFDAALADPARDALPAEERARTGQDPRTLPPAIILDIDETVLENTPFNVDLMHRPIDPGLPVEDFRRAFDERWVAWVRRAEAPRMGGAKAFLDYVAARGVAIRYISNRACAPDDPAMCEEEPTCRNLVAQGLPLPDCESGVILRYEQAPYLEDAEKGSRRIEVGREFRVLLMLGDNLGDFLDGVGVDAPARERLVCAAQARWGVDWFMLSNPLYGSWPRAAENLPPDARFATQGERRQAQRAGVDASLVEEADARERLRTPCLPAAAAGN